MALPISSLSALSGLKSLPLHSHELGLISLFYAFINNYASPRLSAWLFPRTYPRLPAHVRYNWNVHVVSLVQSITVCSFAGFLIASDDVLKSMRRPDRWPDRLWGYSPRVGSLQAFACGYFLWDLVISIRHVRLFGIGLLVHAVAALTVFMLGFRPFVNFYCPSFVLYELSSPFLNIHWFCDKLNLTGSNLQLANGIVLLTTFFYCRIVHGLRSSYNVLHDIYLGLTSDPTLYLPNPAFPSPSYMAYADYQLPVWLAVIYLTANLTLNSLNIYWFYKMTAALRARFGPPFGTRKPVSNSSQPPNDLSCDVSGSSKNYLQSSSPLPVKRALANSDIGEPSS